MDASLEKVIVVDMYDRESGEIITKVVPDIKGKMLRKEVRTHVATGSTIHRREPRLRPVAGAGLPAQGAHPQQERVRAWRRSREHAGRLLLNPQAFDPLDPRLDFRAARAEVFG